MINPKKIGIDIGSTTLKMVVLDKQNDIVYQNYVRHKGQVGEVLSLELNEVSGRFSEFEFAVAITGSAGMGMAERAQIPFVQEVVAAAEVSKRFYPQARTLIDLGGEDAKMVFFEAGRLPDIRMNGACAGGTGAFIDQMADLLHVSTNELGRLAQRGKKIYPIASRCGAFAKTDIQNLISRHVKAEDLALSILHAVALQSITTLARGAEVRPPVVCIGGPLTFMPSLRQSFAEVLGLSENALVLPENSAYFPAWGCALSDRGQVVDLRRLLDKIKFQESTCANVLPPLFADEQEYVSWQETRKVKKLRRSELNVQPSTALFLGIDSGSTTTKMLVLDENDHVVYTFYAANEGHPLKKVMEGLTQLGEQTISHIAGSCATGYGEDLIKSAFGLDYGIVETVAHFTGARYIDPDVSFILDIGGQDMKSIFVSEGAVSRIELNEACSSGCGSFLQNFAATMNLSPDEFTEKACLARHPADLGTRCTVFMNSKVKQSLRENATIGDIAAGLAYSVVKNCIFKVLKVNNLNMLGEHIVVQGGTFRNHAVYRALERLSGKTISSTDHPELMGALGAALYAKRMKS